jgi:protein subunit release factor A
MKLPWEEFKIPYEDYKIHVGPLAGHGGQQVGTTSPEVTVELPGCITITCKIHRSQLKNKNLAIALIELAVDDR